MKKRTAFRVMIAAAALALSGCSTPVGTGGPDPQKLAALLSDAAAASLAAHAAYTNLAAVIALFHDAGAPADPAGDCADDCADRAAPPRRAAAVIAGLTRVDPARYNGWKGACPGCDVDAHTFSLACAGENIPYALLLNEQATRANIVAAAADAVRSLEDGGLLILYLSGHGGQAASADPDEPDGKDETLCLYDGPLRDDAVWDLLMQIRPGIRVWMITDTCHSGTNYRSPRSYTAEARGLGVALLHWGGCGDGQYSYGSTQGGHFTTALVDAWERGQSYDAWFKRARALTPRTQVPTCEAAGDFNVNVPAFQ